MAPCPALLENDQTRGKGRTCHSGQGGRIDICAEQFSILALQMDSNPQMTFCHLWTQRESEQEVCMPAGCLHARSPSKGWEWIYLIYGGLRSEPRRLCWVAKAFLQPCTFQFFSSSQTYLLDTTIHKQLATPHPRHPLGGATPISYGKKQNPNRWQLA